MVEVLTSAPGRELGSRRTGYLMVVVAALLFSINGTVSKVILIGGMTAGQLTELRSAGACLVLLGAALVSNPRSLRLTRAEVPMMALYGIVGFGLVQWFYFIAIDRLPVGIALLLEFTAPVLVALWARFVAHEQVRRRVWGALVLSLVGLCAVAEVWNGSQLNPVGVLAGLGAAVALAVYFIVGEHMVGGRDTLSLTCYAFAFATLLWTAVSPWWQFPWQLLAHPVSLLGRYAHIHLPLGLLTLWVVVVGTVVPFALVVGALRHLRASQAGVVGMVEPVLAGLVAYLWLGETLNVIQLVGGAVVLTGVILAETARGPRPAVPQRS